MMVSMRHPQAPKLVIRVQSNAGQLFEQNAAAWAGAVPLQVFRMQNAARSLKALSLRHQNRILHPSPNVTSTEFVVMVD